MNQLKFDKTKELLKKYKFPYCESFLCKKAEAAAKISKKIGFPVVLKISSPDIIHKSEVKGVVTNINNEKGLKESFKDILENSKKKNPKAKIEGIILQKQETGKEIIIGMKRDSQFGPVIMFGLGGIFVEIFRDVSFRIAPVNEKSAEEMIKEIKAYPLLKGIRGEKAVNINALVNIIVKTSKMIMKEEKITELDFNPVIANQKTAKIVDVRILI